MNETNLNLLVSIIVPCYNQGFFLAESLESLLAQTYPYWECFIIDDGSTDCTKNVALEYTKKDSRIKYVYQKNRGLPAARNRGLEVATGDFIQFLDADDFLAPQKFEIQIKAFQSNPFIDIVYSEYLCFNDQDRNNTWTYSRVKLKNNALLDFVYGWENGLSIPIHCFLYMKSCFKRWGSFNEKLVYGKEDWDLHLKFSLNHAKYFFVDGIMAYYRQGINSMTKNNKKMERGKWRLFNKYLLASDISIRIKKIFLKRIVRDNIKKKEEIIQEQAEQIRQNENQIRQLKEELSNIYNSKGWKCLNQYRKIKNLLTLQNKRGEK